jgi:uncharacterized protein involved in outer membrane biogenesis
MFLFRLLGRLVGFTVKVVVFLGVLAAVAAGVMVALFDADQFKRQVAQRVVDVTGRAMTIGDAELQLGLPPRVILKDVRLRNASWSTRRDMARIKQVTLKLDPVSAISGGTQVSEVNLAGADIVLESTPLGETNWALVAGGGAAAGAGALQALGVLGPVSVSDLIVTIVPGSGSIALPPFIVNPCF